MPSGSTGASGQSGETGLRRYKVGIFSYYVFTLAACGVLALLVMNQRQRDDWHMQSRGRLEAPIETPSQEPPEVRVTDFRVESVSSKPPKERYFAFDPFILLILIIGTVGGTLHGLTSLADHSGRGTLKHGWGPYYAGLPLTGAGMALAIYYILRSGIAGFEVTSNSSPEATYLAWALLAGLFSSNALDKLGDVFDALFQSRRKREEKEKEDREKREREEQEKRAKANRDRGQPTPGNPLEQHGGG